MFINLLAAGSVRGQHLPSRQRPTLSAASATLTTAACETSPIDGSAFSAATEFLFTQAVPVVPTGLVFAQDPQIAESLPLQVSSCGKSPLIVVQRCSFTNHGGYGPFSLSRRA